MKTPDPRALDGIVPFSVGSKGAYRIDCRSGGKWSDIQ